MSKKKNRLSDAKSILHRRYVAGKPAMEKLLEEERCNAHVARAIHDLRIKAGLTQRQLADRVGTTASVICRLEDAEYEGHSLTMLQRIAKAFDGRLEVRIVRRSPTAKKRVSQ